MNKLQWFLLIIWLLVAVMLGLLLYNSARADELWITSGFWSDHTNESAHRYNQNNTGWGVEYKTQELSYIAGEYDNSIFRNARYAGVVYEPWSVADINVGISGGLISGYSRKFAAVPVAAPSASFEFHGIGFNAIWVPSVVVAVQLKVKVW